jgi:hypothetical protein
VGAGELRPGVHPQLRGERAPTPLVEVEGVGLPAVAVHGEHREGPQPLPQRVGGNEGVELAGEAGRAAGPQEGLGAVLRGREPRLLEAADLVLGELVVGHLRQRRSAPQRERLVERRGGPGVVALVEAVAAVRGEAGEAGRVDRVVGGLEDVARGPGDDGPGDHAAQVRHVALDGLRGGVRGRGPPQRVEDPVHPDHPPALHQQQRQEGPLPPRGDPHLGAVLVENPDATKDLEIHGASPYRRLTGPDRPPTGGAQPTPRPEPLGLRRTGGGARWASTGRA